MLILTIVVAVVWGALGLVLLAHGIVGAAGRARRRGRFGMRLEPMLATEQIFAVSNRVGGPSWAAAGAVLLVGGVIGAIGGSWVGLMLQVIAGIGGIALAGFGTMAARRTAERLAPAEAGCGDSCSTCSLSSGCAFAGVSAGQPPADEAANS